ncbi:DUF1349 domain-containing protein [Chitinophaga lutea]|uniref:DUF1349 domain-containing protein n=1 Tax=Chitinophaga lutea TaxID=2488634 RepID=A0A3N4Q2M1_9BACT|nr:DUF1349 domain-containing protein [Chitinophaga lutea]RPE06014.1 DUF1349 domain-containing protein [Chitinophaga lutea]
MKKHFLSLMTLCLAALSVSAGDSLRLKAIPHTLQWQTRPATFTVQSDNAFTMTAGKGTDLYASIDGSFYVNNVPKLLFTPDRDFIFSARLRPEFKNVYDAGAILIYSDSSNWAKVIVEKLDNGSIFIGSSVVDNRITDDSYHQAIPTADVHLKLARSGKVYCFYYSTDGRTWKLLRTFSFKQPQQMRIGFYAQSPKGDRLSLQVSDVRYRGVAFKDFFTGE